MTKLTPAAKRQYAKVVSLEEDGKSMRVQFIRKNGEKVVGIYMLSGWAVPPAKEAAEFKKIISAQPKSIRR